MDSEIAPVPEDPVSSGEHASVRSDANGKDGYRLSLSQRAALSVGHVLNDLCSAVWFTYLLIYMQYVRQLSGSLAGLTLLVGQVADGIATPFVGIESDRQTDWVLCKYGKRKTWHLVGTVCVIFSFPLIFTKCIGCTSDTSAMAQLVYYSAVIVVFQFGWAAVQIAHLALIPDMTSCSDERTEINAWRYAGTVISNVMVYCITWALLGLSKDSEAEEGQVSHVCPKDAPRFRDLVLIIVGIGVLFSIIFHVVVKESKGEDRKRLVDTESTDDTISIASLDYSLPANHLKWNQWFCVGQFYKVSFLYMTTRLCINLTQTYIPFYLQETLRMRRESIAYIPLVMYLSGFASSFLMKSISVKMGKKLTYLLGSGIAIAGFLWLLFVSAADAYFTKYGIYFVTAFIGISGSTMFITSVGITNDLIGHNTSSGAFVFGVMSFFDKVSNGAAVMIIQTIQDSSMDSSSEKGVFYRNVMVFVCGGSAVASVLALALLSRDTIGARKKRDPDSTGAITESSEASGSGSGSKPTTEVSFMPNGSATRQISRL